MPRARRPAPRRPPAHHGPGAQRAQRPEAAGVPEDKRAQLTLVLSGPTDALNEVLRSLSLHPEVRWTELQGADDRQSQRERVQRPGELASVLPSLLPSLHQARLGTVPALKPAARRRGALQVWSDGSADPNPGDGGAGLSWSMEGTLDSTDDCAVDTSAMNTPGLRGGGCGWGAPGLRASNNEMELLAALGALRLALVGDEERGPEELILWVDSEYVRQGLKRWTSHWQARQWRTASGTPVANRALWQALVEHRQLLRARGCRLQVRRVAAHRGDPHNERANTLATHSRGNGAVNMVGELKASEPPQGLSNTTGERASTEASKRSHRKRNAPKDAGMTAQPSGPGTGSAAARKRKRRRGRRRSAAGA